MTENMIADAAFRAEVRELLGYAYEALAEVLLAPDRTAKHPPFTWQAEPQDEHLRKGARHVLTHELVRDDQAPASAEDHLHRAVVRLLMGLALRDRPERALLGPPLPAWLFEPNLPPPAAEERAATVRLERYEDSNRPRVYIAGAYNAGNVLDVLHNMRRGMQLGAAVLGRDMAPFTPWHDYHHTLMQRSYNEITIQDYYEFSMAWLDVSDAVLLVDPASHPRTVNSKGTQGEIQRAKDNEIPIFETLGDLITWRNRTHRWRRDP